MKCLIVEDDFISRRILRELLGMYFDCEIAVDGEEAVTAFRLAHDSKSPYDLICMDIMMPKMDGHEALRLIRQLEKELEGLQPAARRRELDFKWPAPPQSDRTVMSVADLRFAFPDGQRMWQSLSFTLYRGQKIALVGHNGCGKSTLLRLLVGRMEKESGTIMQGQQVRLGYFSQHQLETLMPSGTVLGEIRRLSDPRTTEEELMSVLGLFLLGRNYFERTVETLSGGEKSRLMLATLFLSRSNFLILDEPTNHLDLESREALVEALGEFSGTLFMVAHDRHLLTEAADQIWELTPKGFTIYENGFDEYAEARRAVRSQANAEALAAKKGEVKRTVGLSREEMKQQKRDQAEARRVLYKAMKPLQEQYAALEKELEQTLTEQTGVEATLADPEVYADGAKATELLKRFHTLQARSDVLLEQLGEAEAALAPYEEQKLALGGEG